MRVFISWSKQVSLEVAQALREWLPLVIQDVAPWMSKADIEAGVRWGQELGTELETNDFGILCITAQNRLEPWIHFEAGALSKRVAAGRVIPLLFRLNTTALPGPLQQFQAVAADRDGALRVVESIHSVMLPAKPVLTFETLRRTFDKWWPELEAKWNAIVIPESEPPAPTFNQEVATQEMLLMLREISRVNTRLGGPPGSGSRGGLPGIEVHIVTDSTGAILKFSGAAGVVAKLANDYMQANGIPWRDAMSRCNDIIRATSQAPNAQGLFATSTKFAEAVMYVLERFDAAGQPPSGLE